MPHDICQLFFYFSQVNFADFIIPSITLQNMCAFFTASILFMPPSAVPSYVYCSRQALSQPISQASNFRNFRILFPPGADLCILPPQMPHNILPCTLFFLKSAQTSHQSFLKQFYSFFVKFRKGLPDTVRNYILCNMNSFPVLP